MTRKRLPPGQQLVAPAKWPVIGEREPANSVPPQSLTLSGRIESPVTMSLDELRTLPLVDRVIDIHCVTRWSKFDVPFRGILLKDLLDRAKPESQARFVSFISQSERNHSTSLPLDVALEHQTLIALEHNGMPLEVGHGGPIRNIVPGKYFYKSVKWLREIRLLAEDELGYWEAESGYHNNADPWKVERYMAPNLDRRAAAKLIESRNFKDQDLRSIDASGRDLDGLNATSALLRYANFNDCSLVNSDFSKANLSNSHFRNADLSRAMLVEADLEGSDLCGANLAGADLTGCSLIGATFCEPDESGGTMNGARLTVDTKLDPASVAALTPFQIQYLESQGFYR